MRELRRRGGYWKKPGVWGSLSALFGSTLFAVAIVGMVVLPVRESKRAAWLQTRIQSRYIAEDVMLRALTKSGFFEVGHALIPEGVLAPDPTLPARVSLRWGREGNILVARLRRGGKELVYEGSYGYGELLREYSLSLGQGDPSGEWNPTDIRILGGQGRLKLQAIRETVSKPQPVEDGVKDKKKAAAAPKEPMGEPSGKVLAQSLLSRHLGTVRPFDVIVRGGTNRRLGQEESARDRFQRT